MQQSSCGQACKVGIANLGQSQPFEVVANKPKFMLWVVCDYPKHPFTRCKINPQICHQECAGNSTCIYISTSTSPTAPAVLARQEAERLRQFLSSFTSIQGVTNCGMKFLHVKVTHSGREVMEIIDRCRNKHVCPPCMGYAYWKLRNELIPLLEQWVSAGRSVYTQTLTLPNRNLKLIYKHENLSKTWKAMGKTKRFSKIKKEFGVSQYLRILEDVLRLKGSFPHFHLTWFFSRELSEVEMTSFCNQVATLWAESAQKLGIRGTNSTIQWCGPIRSSAKAYATYLLKHGYLDLNFDPRSPLQLNQGLKPLDFLRVLHVTGDYEMYKVWLDYESATFHRHRIQPSKGFAWTL